MSASSGRVLLIDAAGLSYAFVQSPDAVPAVRGIAAGGGTFAALRPSFPAVTCSVQAALTTGVGADRHGIVANGCFDRERMRVSFWEQSDRLVQAERIWTAARRRNPAFKSAMLFWQNSVGSGNDVILTPAPIHLHAGGMVQSCYAKPEGLYEDLVQEIGKFNLMGYWGPWTSVRASRWIARATVHVLDRFTPHLVLTYLPHMDYNQQRWGPGDPRLRKDLEETGACIAEVADAARKKAYDVVLVSDYGMSEVRRAVHLNRALRDAKLLAVREVRGMEYLDYGRSRAFAMVDHQIAHVFCEAGAVEDARAAIGRVEGVEAVYDRAAQKELQADHPRSGELIAVAQRDAWFAYPWWTDPGRAPDYAAHIDIHNKPGYDPAELFQDWGSLARLRLRVSQDASLVRGSHGRIPGPLAEHGIFVSSFPVKDAGAAVTDRDVHRIVAERLGVKE